MTATSRQPASRLSLSMYIVFYVCPSLYNRPGWYLKTQTPLGCREHPDPRVAVVARAVKKDGHENGFEIQPPGICASTGHISPASLVPSAGRGVIYFDCCLRSDHPRFQRC